EAVAQAVEAVGLDLRLGAALELLGESDGRVAPVVVGDAPQPRRLGHHLVFRDREEPRAEVGAFPVDADGFEGLDERALGHVVGVAAGRAVGDDPRADRPLEGAGHRLESGRIAVADAADLRLEPFVADHPRNHSSRSGGVTSIARFLFSSPRETATIRPDSRMSVVRSPEPETRALPGVLCQFLERASIAIGCTRDAKLAPNIHYSSGWQLDPDQRSIWCFIPEPFTPGLRSSLEENGHFALTVEHIGPHECYQFKGVYVSMRPSIEADREIVARCR